MEHVVFFPAHDGTPAFRRVGALEDAVRLVEHLRNVEGVSEVSVHALAEVPLSFKTWYRVEVPPTGAVEIPAELPLDVPVEAPVDLAVEAPVEVAVDVPLEPITLVPDQPFAAEVPVLAGSSSRPTDGPSSLGFFAS